MCMGEVLNYNNYVAWWHCGEGADVCLFEPWSLKAYLSKLVFINSLFYWHFNCVLLEVSLICKRLTNTSIMWDKIFFQINQSTPLCLLFTRKRAWQKACWYISELQPNRWKITFFNKLVQLMCVGSVSVLPSKWTGEAETKRK